MRRIRIKSIAVVLLIFVYVPFARAEKPSSKISFLISCTRAPEHYFHVEMKCETVSKDSFDVKMPVWMPGYYQIMDYAKNLEGFSVTDNAGNPLKWTQVSKNTWRIYSNGTATQLISYEVKATTQFVATSYIDENRGYISPAGIFLHISGKLNIASTITIQPLQSWNRVACGLDSVSGKPNTFVAPDFDILYDSPILMGNLEELPPFYVKGIPHRFIGYKLGDFDRVKFMDDLKKVVEVGSGIIGDIPYKQYTFLAIGPGRGGIEHLNSCTISFEGSQFGNREAEGRIMSFIAHEYFHHYNVKRIRPIELGPFDYDRENKTKGLWVSEGLNVFYEYIICSRAGILDKEELFKAFQANISAYENKPGHLYQSLSESSYETWSDGPFGRTGDEINKTISYYDKGPAVGLMLDFSIRNATNNQKSLDDVMRFFYGEYYLKRKRGFTEDEFRHACDSISGKSQGEVFEYVNTVKEPDYKKFLGFGGLDIDTAESVIPGPYLGANGRDRNDSLFLTNVDWNSPAWKAGMRSREVVISENGSKVNGKQFRDIIDHSKEGDTLNFQLLSQGNPKTVQVVLGKKVEKSFKITELPQPDKLQASIKDSMFR